MNRIVFAAEFYDFGFSARIFMFECQIANRTRLVGWLFFPSHFVSSRDVFSCNHFNCTQIEMKRERTKPASKRNSISRSNTKTHCSKNRFHVRFFLHKCVVSCLEVWFRPSLSLALSWSVSDNPKYLNVYVRSSFRYDDDMTGMHTVVHANTGHTMAWIRSKCWTLNGDVCWWYMCNICKWTH